MTTYLPNGQEFKLISKNPMYLRGTKKQWILLAEVKGGALREYALIQHAILGDVYLNEVTPHGFEMIEDDELFKAVYAFLLDAGVVIFDLNSPAKEIRDPDAN